ncbi:MAG: hypothetical protein SWJ54_01720 [Cyanobacteriota bacterium]|nr:hypothetical protein [Cyanobacteriota bacterium]
MHSASEFSKGLSIHAIATGNIIIYNNRVTVINTGLDTNGDPNLLSVAP